MRVVGPRLPEPLRWHSWEAQVKVEQMDALARRGGVDVVFLGTSMIDGAMEPARLRALWGGRTTAYNAALARGVPKVMVEWARHTVLPRLRPSLVVIGLSSNDVNDNGPGLLAFDDVADAPAAQREWGRRTGWGRIEDAATEASELFRLRTQLRDPSILLDALRKGRRPRSEADFVGPDGSMRIQRDELIAPGPDDERIAAESLASFRIGEVETRAIRELVGTARAAGADVALVQMPVHPRYAGLHPRGPSDYARAKATIARIAGSVEAPLLDLDRLTDDRYFADVAHLNGAGAAWFTDRFARWAVDRGLIGR